MKNYYKYIGISFICISFLIGSFLRILDLYSYTEFKGDQARDSYIYIEMKEGKLPYLGPSASVSEFSLPPQYYYINYPASLLGEDPRYHFLTNSVLSILSIPLIIFLTYSLLENIDRKKALFFSSISGIWWSIFQVDLLMNGRSWNPSSIPFFLMSFFLLFNILSKNRYGKIFSIFLWGILGIVVSILISLHATTLFIIPVVFIIFSIVFILKEKKLYPFFALSTITITMIPYFIGEIENNWKNTKNILTYIPFDINLTTILIGIIFGVITLILIIKNKKILSSSSLEYKKKRILAVLIPIFFLSVEGFYEHYFRYYLNNQYNNLINTNDIIEILDIVPENKNICYEDFETRGRSFEYMDTYVLTKSHTYSKDCDKGSYFLSTEIKNDTQNGKLILEKNNYQIYEIN